MAKAITKDQLGDCLDRVADYFLEMNEDFEGATESTAGTKGMVPTPAAGDNAKFLRGDGTWAAQNSNVFVVSATAPSDPTGIMWIKTTD